MSGEVSTASSTASPLGATAGVGNRLPPSLEYAITPPWHRRRLLRRITLALLLCTLGFVGWQYGPHAWQFARDRYWYRQCLHFTAPPNVPVYEELPNGSPRPRIAPPFMDGDDPRVRALMTPYLMKNQVGDSPPVIVVRVPACLVSLRVPFRYTLPPEPGACIFFCHGRASVGGHHRLVSVALNPFPDIGDLLEESLVAMSCDTPGWSGVHPYEPQGKGFGWSGRALPFPRRIFAGQPDLIDASHFTIEYEWPDGSRGIVDGWLLDDGSVKLAIRPGPGDIASARESMRRNPTRWEH